MASYLDITHIEKKNTALIVPNAIEVCFAFLIRENRCYCVFNESLDTSHLSEQLSVRGEKVFFASFVFRCVQAHMICFDLMAHHIEVHDYAEQLILRNENRIYRDECFQCLQQLQAIKKGTVALLTGREADDESEADGIIADSPFPAATAGPAMESSSGKTSPVSMASVAPTPSSNSSEGAQSVADDGGATEVSSTSSVKASPPVVTEAPRVPEKDSMLNEYEVILDEIIPIR